MRILVVNAGSSTLKLSIVDGEQTPAATTVEHADQAGIGRFVADHGPVDATGHRIVHGGVEFRAPVIIDDTVLARLATLTPLAPIHQPAGLAGVRAAQRAVPGAPAIACFDTAFHTTIPAHAATYALPAEWRDRFSLRRYGFHGLSHSWASRRAAAIVGPRIEARRTITCHLGSGSSLCAILDGRSVDTTMGFTPLEGLVMATRSGSVDPGLVIWLIEHGGLSASEVSTGLERRSGLAGLSGTAGDMRELLGSADMRAQLALGVWTHRLRREIGAMSASLGGLDTLVFTGGIGEHAHELRARVCAGLAFLGVELAGTTNASASADADIGAAGAPVRTVVVTAREDLEIAHLVVATIGAM